MFPLDNTAKELLLWSIESVGKIETPEKYLRPFRRENFLKRKHSLEFNGANRIEFQLKDFTGSAVAMAGSAVHATRDVRPW